MITAPKWMKDPVPSTRGWHDRRTGELQKSMKISAADIAEWEDAHRSEPKKLEPVKAPEEPVAPVAPVVKKTRKRTTKTS